MKTVKCLMALAVALAAVLITNRMLGADGLAPAQASGLTPAAVIQWLTPAVVPLLLAGVKQVMPKLPTWTIPLLAPVLGILLDVVNSMATSHQSNFLAAAALGLAGVGIREVKDTLKPAPNGGWPSS